MRKQQKLTTGALVAFGLFAVPGVVAHADTGVVKVDLTAKGNNEDTVTLKTNEKIHLKRENKDVYVVEVDKKEYKVDKDAILKTAKHVEESLSITNIDASLKATPDMFGSTLIQLQEGDIVKRVEGTEESNGFVKVRTKQNVEGWVVSSSLKVNFNEEAISHTAYIKDDAQKNKGFVYRDEIRIVGFKEGKYEVKKGDATVLVETNSVSFTQPAKRVPKVKPKPKPQPKPQPRYVEKKVTVASEPKERVEPVNTTPAHNGSIADRIIATGSDYLGVPYVWGGTSPSGFDCSGFTQYVLSQNGISSPRVASAQAGMGVSISRGSLQKGDMVYFETYKPGPSHVGFYIGNGQFLHAGGDRVQISNMNDSYWSTRYLFAKRVF